MKARLAMHTWTLLTTPMADIVTVAARTGWDGIEVSRQSIAPATPLGLPLAEIGRLLKVSGLPLACVGAGHGWMWADGEARKAMLATFDEACGFAASFDCPVVMSPVDQGRGDLARAAASVREAGGFPGPPGARPG